MGFSSRWFSWIMFCIEMVDYSMLINGASVSTIVHERGLRYGDPFSPYLVRNKSDTLDKLKKIVTEIENQLNKKIK